MNIAVFTKNLSNPAYAAARLGADRVAAQFGVAVRHYVPTVPDDPAQQSALIDAALATRPDAFVFTPVHVDQVDAAIDRIVKAGIPIFGFVNRMKPGLCTSYVGSADDRLAADIAGYLFAAMRGRGRLVIVTGPTESVTSIERVDAFDAAVARHPGIETIARCNGAYQREPAREAFAAVLRAQPQVDAVLCANDIMAIGVLDALQAAGRTALVVGVNAIPQAVEAIARGEMLATADFNAMQMCALATECAVRHLRGEAVPAEIELPVAIVHRGNCAQWALPYAERTIPSLASFVSHKEPA